MESYGILAINADFGFSGVMEFAPPTPGIDEQEEDLNELEKRSQKGQGS